MDVVAVVELKVDVAIVVVAKQLNLLNLKDLLNKNLIFLSRNLTFIFIFL